MIGIQGKLPRKLYVAVSGGIDSMAALDFLKGSHEVEALYFDHGTKTGQEAYWTVMSYCSQRDIKIHRGKLETPRPADKSPEEHWRDLRYTFFGHFADRPIVMAHHLDDCVEQWIFSSLHGTPNLIPYRRGNVIRPFRLTRKAEFVNWAKRKGIPWHEDYSNEDLSYMRNFIRSEIVPKALVVNPGLHKMIAKKLAQETA